MYKPRLKNDGLPFRLYERRGVKYYSIGYKGPQNKWLFREQCLVSDLQRIRELRRDAITKANTLNQGGPKTGTFGALIEVWFERQEKLPIDSEERRAKTTLDENRREAANLKKHLATYPCPIYKRLMPMSIWMPVWWPWIRKAMLALVLKKETRK